MYYGDPPKNPPNPAECKPTLREGAVGQMTNQFRLMLETLHVDMFKTCVTCINFKEANPLGQPAAWCVRYSPQVGPVPPRIVAYGCSAYFHDDEIPF